MSLILLLLNSNCPNVRPNAVALPRNPSPSGSRTSTRNPNGARYSSWCPRTSNGMPGPRATTVSPRVPLMRLRTPVSGGSAPPVRLTSQTPSRSATEEDSDRGSLPGNLDRLSRRPRQCPREVGLEVADLRRGRVGAHAAGAARREEVDDRPRLPREMGDRVRCAVAQL